MAEVNDFQELDIKHLDDVLKLLCTNKSALQNYRYPIWISEQTKIPPKNVERVISKLYSDDLLDSIEYNPKDIGYTISYNGLQFWKSGGYGKSIRDNSIQTRLQIVQTWAIVIGTFFAGFYGVVQSLESFGVFSFGDDSSNTTVYTLFSF